MTTTTIVSRLHTVTTTLPLLFLSLLYVSTGCPIVSSKRNGLYVVESSVRTTSNPNVLYAVVEEYNHSQEPFSFTKVAINITTGDILTYNNLPSYETLDIKDKLQPTTTTTTTASSYDYIAVLSNDKTNVTLYANNSNNTVPLLTFATNRSSSSDKSNHHPYPNMYEDAFFWSPKLNHGYYFYNYYVSLFEIYPTVVILNGSQNGDILNLSSTIQLKDDDYGPLGHFHGPIQNVWDNVQVVELQSSGVECVNSVYVHYTTTSIHYTSEKFQNTIVQDNENGEYYYYTVENIELTNHQVFENETVPYRQFRLSKIHLSTGRTDMESILQFQSNNKEDKDDTTNMPSSSSTLRSLMSTTKTVSVVAVGVAILL